MRHANSTRKFGRKVDVRRALMRSLARSLVLHESIETTEAKAKELRPYVEKLVTKGRAGSVVARRAIDAVIGAEASKKVMTDLAPRYAKRTGGYTRITKSGIRRSGAVPMARISFVK